MYSTVYNPQMYPGLFERKPPTQPESSYLAADRLLDILAKLSFAITGGFPNDALNLVTSSIKSPLGTFFSFYSDYQSDPSGFAEVDYKTISNEQLQAAIIGMSKLLSISRLDVEPSPTVYPEGNIGANWNLDKSSTLSIEFYDDGVAVCVIKNSSEFKTIEWSVDSGIPVEIKSFLSHR